MTETRSLTDEDRMLDEAIVEATPILAESLMREEHARRRKRRWIAGAIAMSAIIVGLSITLSLLTADPSAAEDLTKQGWALWRQQDYSAAVETFQEAVEQDPQDVSAWNGLGWSRFNGGLDLDAATEAFERCIKLSPDYPAALNGLGQIALADDRLDEAEDWLLKAAPQAPAAWFGLTRIYLLQGDWEQAKQWGQKLIIESPDNTLAREMLAAAEAEALPDALREQIRPRPQATDDSSAAELSQRGWMKWNQQKWLEAEHLFREAVELDPAYPAAQNGLGWSLLNQGKRDQAIKHFETCLEIEPEHIGAMNGLAICLKARGDVDEAIAVWKRGLEISPQPNALMSGLARTYLERRQYAEALPLLEQLVAANPADQELQGQLKLARNKTQAEN